MKLHSHPLYEAVEDIPELVPEKIWLPSHSPARVAKAPEVTPETTSPVEVGFALYELDANNFANSPLEGIVMAFEEELESPANYLEKNMGNHVGRVLLKAMLDPARHAPIDLLAAYRAESKFRGYSEREEHFFANFVKSWGVLERD